MRALERFAAFLDKKAFLSYRLWQFSLRNTRRYFPWFYLFRVLLRHPILAGAGLQRYRRAVRCSGGLALSGTACLDEMEDAARAGQRFLIAPGFCLKPYDYKKGKNDCPAGQFNHDCVLLGQAQTLLLREEKWPEACSRCGIAPLAQAAARCGADFYIMTSALDIARDVYVPAIKNHNARLGLFFLCPYSCEPFTFGLATSGIKGAILTFCRGACANHAEWTRADVGIKNEQTFVAEDTFQNVLARLDRIAVSRQANEPVRYVRSGHAYRRVENAILEKPNDQKNPKSQTANGQ